MLKSKRTKRVGNDSRRITMKELELAKRRVVHLAMKRYRNQYYELNLLIDELYDEYGLPKEITREKLINWEPVDESLQSKIDLIRKSYVFLETLKNATERLVNYAEKGKEIHYIMKYSYLNKQSMTTGQISENLGISESTCYRLKKIGFKLLSFILWNVPIQLNKENNVTVSFYELFMEVSHGERNKK